MFIQKALLILSIVAAVSSNSFGHHSFAAQYDGTKAVRLIGVLSKVEWTNPHSYFYVDVKNDKGVVETWVCEGAGPGALSRRGLNRGSLKLGDTLVVDGYRSKNGAKMIDARRVTLPDGRTIYGGTPGDGGPGENPAAKPAPAAK